MEMRFMGVELQHMPRGANKEAHDVAKRSSRRLPQEPGVFEEHVTPTMRLYLPRIEARLRGITAWWFLSQEGSSLF